MNRQDNRMRDVTTKRLTTISLFASMTSRDMGHKGQIRSREVRSWVTCHRAGKGCGKDVWRDLPGNGAK